jgi:hypothetical protein
MRYAKGIMWLDDCRIPFVDEGDIQSAKPGSLNATGEFSMFGLKSGNELDTKGRFTPNLLVCDDMLNDGSITKAGEYKGEGSKSGGIWNNSTGKPAGVEYGDKGSSSRYYDLDLWFDKILERL